jgi:3-hydroxyisobutyrate dehydrogenase
MAARESIAVLGTGQMGTPIARDLLGAGFSVTVWNRTRPRAEALAGDGATVADTPGEAAAEAKLVLTMLTDGSATMETMDGPTGAAKGMQADSIWIQMGTVGVDWTERLAKSADAEGITFVDAPVSGSTGPAEQGALVVLASGPDSAHSRVQPVFDVVGRRTFWLGGAGNGSRMKVVLNNWLASSTEALAETLALSDALGLDPDRFVEVFDDNPMASTYAQAKGQAMISGDFTPGFPLKHAFKDTVLALDAAKETGVELPVTAALEDRWRQAISRGHGDEDLSVIITEATRRNGSPG